MQCVVGGQDHVTFMLFFARAVSLVLIALSLPITFTPSPKCFTPVPREAGDTGRAVFSILVAWWESGPLSTAFPIVAQRKQTRGE